MSMFSKLAFRNMKRSFRDYMIYILTLMLVTALIYSFSSLYFPGSFENRFDASDIMIVMTGFATVLVFLITAWLIHYMVRFMLTRRSREFGIYMLLGMKKQEIRQLYMRENVILGVASFLGGIIMGILLQQVLMVVLYAMLQEEYRLRFRFNAGQVIITLLCYSGCFGLAMLRCRRTFKQMNILELMNAQRRNEKIQEAHVQVLQLLFPAAAGLIVVYWLVFDKLTDIGEAVIFFACLIVTIYIFYIGLSSFIVCRIRNKGRIIYHGQNLFLLRQFAAKVRTMQFTMGSLTALFIVALFGSAAALMFNNYEDTVLPDKFPFDVQIFSENPNDDFADELKILEKNTDLEETCRYLIYTDEKQQANSWMYTHLDTFGTDYLNKDGTPDTDVIQDALQSDGIYCTYDTYMTLSDYNQLRKMLGYQPVSIGNGEYVIQVKSRLKNQVQGMENDLKITGADGGTLSFAGFYTEPFSQDGHNGGDYIIVVPDDVAAEMKPYYAELAVKLKGSAPQDLMKQLDDLDDTYDFTENIQSVPKGNNCSGSDNIIVLIATNLVRENLIPETKYMLASLILPAFYIGLVFVCVALTVLSVQQLADTEKYRERYDLLWKLGLGKRQIDRLLWKQLIAFYLCPVLLAVIISGKMILHFGNTFVSSLGVPTAPGVYMLQSTALFLGIYVVYFVITYITFKRSVM